MIRFNNDYNRGCIPAILDALRETNDQSFPGYGTDEICTAAATLLRDEIGWSDADIHFLPGATQANFIVHAAALRPIESVIAAATGHIVGHEAGSVENTGHQILSVPSDVNGKLTAGQIEALAQSYREAGAPEHLTEPRLVYISQPTEYGALYSLEELQAIKDVCEEYELLLFVDGARLAYALGSEHNDVTLWDLAALCDAFTIGGTKCGALFGEALILTHDALKRRFRTYMKQNGAVLAKGWLLGLQFYTLFAAGEYARIGSHADALAMQIRHAFIQEGLSMYNDSCTNQQFIILRPDQQNALKEQFIFEHYATTADGQDILRFCTSWATTQEEADALVSAIHRLPV